MTGLPENYARVLFDMNIESGDIEEAREILTGSGVLMDAMTNPLVRKQEKRNVIEKLLPESVRSFVKVMSDNDDMGCVNEMFRAYDELVRAREDTILATFTYVTRPDDAQIESLKNKIAKEYNRKHVKLKLVEDPSIIGGFILTIGDSVVDQSVRTSMNKLRRHFSER